MIKYYLLPYLAAKCRGLPLVVIIFKLIEGDLSNDYT